MDPKLTQITPDGAFRGKVELILQDLEAKKYPSFIAEAKRTVEQQKEKVRLGYSKTMKSYHLPGKDGLARAADIVQQGKGWNASKRYWMMLGSSAWAHSVGWGGLFGLNRKQIKALQDAIHRLRQKGWPIDDADYQTAIGWDGAHVETRVNWPAYG